MMTKSDNVTERICSSPDWCSFSEADKIMRQPVNYAEFIALTYKLQSDAPMQHAYFYPPWRNFQEAIPGELKN